MYKLIVQSFSSAATTLLIEKWDFVAVDEARNVQ
jgi:hypothetical protein